MKQHSGISLPHPVIGLDDNVSGSFSVIIDQNIDNSVLVVTLKEIVFDNEYYKQLYNNSEITPAIKIRCSNTMKTWTSIDLQEIRIPCEDLSEKAKTEVLLVAKKDIAEYKDDSFHDDFKTGPNKGSFIVKKGMIVGAGDEFDIEFSSRYTTGLSGIIEFNPCSNDTPVTIDLGDNDKIIINYPFVEGTNDIVATLSAKGSSYKETFLNLFLLPALTQAYSLILEEDKKGNKEKYIEENIWASVLDGLCNDYTSEDSFEIAQYCLRNLLSENGSISEFPCLRAFTELQN